ncbi:hypothetical protein HAX54_017495 [Datura stramonium]|uniref:Uncharacterized protein n=1 Tax=Datura stramonium TaxID=4076 RepID=A0ABS8S2K3_DATST|nr:hypothetical protein [Datura stramonium]
MPLSTPLMQRSGEEGVDHDIEAGHFLPMVFQITVSGRTHLLRNKHFKVDPVFQQFVNEQTVLWWQRLSVICRPAQGIDMPEWKQWHVLEKGKFPILQELSIAQVDWKGMKQMKLSITDHQSLTCKHSASYFEANRDILLREIEIGGIRMPSFVSVLASSDCPNLQSLPVKGMPSSISRQSISYCPVLKPLLEYGKGEYWPNIAHISTINIDWEYL